MLVTKDEEDGMLPYTINKQTDHPISSEEIDKSLEGMAEHIAVLKIGETFMILDEHLKLSLTFRKEKDELVLTQVQPSKNTIIMNHIE
ncbi:MAG: hypothetical protein SCK57_11555 [Bacillota bacterium]|nr:hypothetical protein [Bacillota bacterium]MDW7678286.1 hypothetical protein [Bacillota bacterium]